jgi:hypothetical protein
MEDKIDCLAKIDPTAYSSSSTLTRFTRLSNLGSSSPFTIHSSGIEDREAAL